MSTALVKGLAFDTSVAPLVSHMAVVNDHREALQRLQDGWDQLTLLGQMSGIAADMSATGGQFHGLTQSLLDSLAQRLLVNAKHELLAKAQMSIDILVRNLFERTADVGFLATDSVLRQFLEADAESAAAMRRVLQARFAAYVAKYSVYDDVIVLSPSGEVLVRLDSGCAAVRCAETFVKEAARPGVPFVESFGSFDVLGGRRGLVYAAAIRAGGVGSLLGVLCLSFRFDDETQRVFSNVAAEGERGAVALIDRHGLVIASSDVWQLPLGARLQPEDNQLYFAGREYLAVLAQARAYQGYAGPPWRACAVLPMTRAFHRRRTVERSAALPAGAMEQSTLFGEELRRIPRQALSIQKGLERSVWNGQIHGRRRTDAGSNARFAAVLLQQVTSTGERIRRVFEQAIGELQQSAADSVLDETRFSAELGVDILDRNLYERANDCRWWALDQRLQQALLQSERGEQATQVLRHINSLYTVYAQLLLLDAQGNVVAGSADIESGALEAEWVRRALSLGDPQAYVRSNFERTALYGDRHSYVYSAAVQAPNQRGAALGAVAIVFDSAPQFEAMLRDSLPRDNDGQPLAQAVGLFISRDGVVIASTDARFPVGTRPAFDAGLASLDRGECRSMVLELEGELFAASAAMSRGYREYQSSELQSADDVACLVLISLCQRSQIVIPAEATTSPAVLGEEAGELGGEIATFRCGDQWLALAVTDVLEAVDPPTLTVLPASTGDIAGLMIYRNEPLPVLDVRAVRSEEGDPESNAPRPVIICETGGERFGLRVDELGTVCDVAAAALQPLPDYMVEHDPAARALIYTRDNLQMVVLLEAGRLRARIKGATGAVAAAA